MLAAVYVDDFAGAEGEGAFGDGDAGEGHVLRQAEAADGGEAFGDEAAVAIQHDGGHVGLDDAGAQLVDEDVVFGEAVGEDFGHHAHAGLGDAVFGAAGAGDDGAHGADVDDHAGAVAGEHVAREGLGEEEGAAQVDAHDLVVAGLGHFEDVDALARGHAGVVDEEVDAAPGGEGLAQQGRAAF